MVTLVLMSEYREARPGSELRSITAILRGGGEIDRDPLAVVLEIVYDRLRDLASAYMRGQPDDHSMESTELAHEAVARMLRGREREFVNRRHIIATASRAMRQILVDHARHKKRLKRGGDRARLPLDAIVLAFEGRSTNLLDVDAALERLAELDERAAQLVELRFFLGLTMDEIAETLDTPKRTVEREWTTARAWLRKEIAG